MLTRDDYLYFTDRALDGMASLVAELGDERANAHAYPGANTPYALLHHCLAVVDTWVGGFVRGRPVDRDREAEFSASGPVDELLGRCAQTRMRMHTDVGAAEPEACLLRQPPAEFLGPARELTQAAALQHVFEELAQHHGQMETLRDVLARQPSENPERLRDGHGAKWTAVPPTVLPAWVADMDLGIPPAVSAALRQTLDRQDLGYPHWPEGDPVVNAFTDRMMTRYGWTPMPDRTRVFSDLIQVLQVVIEQTTSPGDAVALHVPTYPPFLAAIERAGRTIVSLRLRESGELDLEQHRDAVAQHKPRLLIVVNPHNPTGRVFRVQELRALADLVRAQQIPVFADEIHSDLTYAPYTHVPFASLGPDVAALTVTATSATKAFNLAGIRCAVAHVGHQPTARALDRAPLDYFGTPSVLSRKATVAAWRDSDAWQKQMADLLHRNRTRVSEWVATQHGLRYREPEATYLAWLDFSGTALFRDPAKHILDGGVQLSAGADFSQHTAVDTASFARLNFATTPDLLEQILERIERCLRTAAR
ncbi:aminotransferase class I/II-fold pyridoxal phosphate-dependent enzyme [Mycobacterium sp. MS1601]|uniref:aminotransferase class I/II-fold pyridoxal phosphate-dependent enzyme n=1 Tax=Mycobacterium sp. MS1601 TaxID=1936029 RepID=UPI001F00A0C7|nr:aminotransferase class I/II-fold pyridoxal phosphate-dependent enzyme [Mycobacterium sp. MS1601]